MTNRDLSFMRATIITLILYVGFFFGLAVARADSTTGCYAWVLNGTVWYKIPTTCTPVIPLATPTPYGDTNPACTGEEVTNIAKPIPGLQNCGGTGWDRMCMWFYGSSVTTIPLKCDTTVLRCSQYTLSTIGKPVPPGYVYWGQCFTTATKPHQYVPMWAPNY